MNIQIKFYFFIENLCFCSLKIAVCALKIPIISKNCRLKIADISKNYRLKIAVRVCMCARMYVRVYACMIEEHRTQDRTQHTNGTHDHQKKGGIPAKQNLLLVGDLHAKNEKKLKKVCK